MEFCVGRKMACDEMLEMAEKIKAPSLKNINK